MLLVRVLSSYFVAGIIVTDGIIIESAPILHWTVSKSIAWFNTYCQRKNWKTEELGQIQ
jgi:hypothetical protein